MNGQTAIITGASSGLGFACADALLERDPTWHVVLAVRDVDRGRQAMAQLHAPERCTVMALDLASLKSVRRFGERYADVGLPPTRALVCNAGTQVVSAPRVTEDGYELMFGVNHLGHFALACELLEQLARPARIIVVSSDTHDPAKRVAMPAPSYTTAAALAHPTDEFNPRTTGRRRYTTSKLCNVLFAYELHRREAAGGIAVNAFNPGLMPGSGLARDYGRGQRFAWRYVLPVLRILPQVHSVGTSGNRLAALVGDPRYSDVSGEYFDGLTRIRSSVDSYDLDKALDLWQTSERLVRHAVATGSHA
jgi:light-dependent protochlorophyllide reductase